MVGDHEIDVAEDLAPYVVAEIDMTKGDCAAADGKRFLMNIAVGDTAETPLTVVVNWLAAVKK